MAPRRDEVADSKNEISDRWDEMRAVKAPSKIILADEMRDKKAL